MSDQSEGERSTGTPSPDGDGRAGAETCPRCSGDLVWFRLGERAAAVCDACGYVGVPVDHHARGDAPAEAWDDAVEQARASAGDAAVETATASLDPTIEDLFDPIDSSPYRLDGWDEGRDGGSGGRSDPHRTAASEPDSDADDER